MRKMLSIAAAVALLAVIVSAPASAATTYHGTWTSAGWTGCPFPPEVPAQGNWNVTLLPDGHHAVVHMTMFTSMPDRIHVDSWGGESLGSFWTVDSVTAHGFALHVEVPAGGNTAASTFTFVLTDGTLTFAIAPWVLLNPDGSTLFACDAAVATGLMR